MRELRFDPPPTRKEESGGNLYAIWDISRPPETMRIEISAEIDLERCDLATAKRGKSAADAKALAKWIMPEKFIESDHPAIRAAAAEIPAGDDLAAIRAIDKLVQDHLKPGTFESADRGAAWAWQNRGGDCSEYSDLFVALCRARGIPAFTCEGFLTTEVRPGDTAKHQWAEAHLDGVGWVPFDPFHIAKGSATLDQLDPTRIITSVRRNDEKLVGYHHWYYQYWGDKIDVSDSFVVMPR